MSEQERAAASSISSPGIVYFVSYETVVKIGHTCGLPSKRLMGLQACSPVPLSLDATKPGTLTDEQVLHARFAGVRLHFEWFQYTDEIKELVIDARRSFGPPHPTYGVPNHLFDLALADIEDAEDMRRLVARRDVDAHELFTKVQTYHGKGLEAPHELMTKLVRTSSLLASRVLVRQFEIRDAKAS